MVWGGGNPHAPVLLAQETALGVWGEGRRSPAYTKARRSAQTPAAARLQAAEPGEAWLDTAAHQWLGSTFILWGGRGSQGKDEGRSPCRKLCQVMACLTLSHTTPQQHVRQTGLQGVPGSVRLLPAPCPQPGQPLEQGQAADTRYLSLLRMDRGHRLLAHTGASGPTPGTTCLRREQWAGPRGAALAAALGRGRGETGRETNLFQALAASLGPIFSLLGFFFFTKNLTQTLT